MAHREFGVFQKVVHGRSQLFVVGVDCVYDPLHMTYVWAARLVKLPLRGSDGRVPSPARVSRCLLRVCNSPVFVSLAKWAGHRRAVPAILTAMGMMRPYFW